MRVTPGPTVTGSVDVNDGLFETRFRKFKDGKGYWAGTENISPSAAGNVVQSRLRNPAASGKTLFVTRLMASASINTTMDLDAPEADAGASLGSAMVANNLKQGGAAAVGVASFKNNSVGTTLANPPFSFRINVTTIDLQLGFILPAGSQTELDFDDTATATVYTWTWEWYEE